MRFLPLRFPARVVYTSLAALSALSCSSVRAQEPRTEDVYAKALPSIMTLTVQRKDGKVMQGTAFLAIKDGLAVTAWHVVNGAAHVTAKFSTGEEFDASGLVDKDPKRDVAIIRVKVFGRPILGTVPADPAIGSKALVIGAPRGLDFSLSDGIVSQIQTLQGMKEYQFTCASSPGNSGGPLLNNKGEVTGVVSWQLRDSQNLNFAVPISYVLGLDTTLPTQPWETVKAEESFSASSSTSTATSDEVFDKTLADSWMVEDGAKLARYRIRTEVISVNNAYKNGVPYWFYSAQHDVEEQVKQWLKVTSNDPVRERLRQDQMELLTRELREGILIIEALKLAQASRGYTDRVNDLIAQAVAVRSETFHRQATIEDREQIRKSQVIKDALPIDAQIFFGIAEDASGFNIGIGTPPSNSLFVANVLKDGLGDNLGIKEGDFLLREEDVDLTSFAQFKTLLKAAKGKTVHITVRRNGKEKVIKSDVPMELPAPISTKGQ